MSWELLPLTTLHVDEQRKISGSKVVNKSQKKKQTAHIVEKLIYPSFRSESKISLQRAGQTRPVQ